jgi:hypothetical protein
MRADHEDHHLIQPRPLICCQRRNHLAWQKGPLNDDALPSPSHRHRPAPHARSSIGRRWSEEQTSIALLVDTCVFDKSDATFMDQIPRWVLQFPPARFLSSLAGVRVGYERELKQRPDNSKAQFALKMRVRLKGRHDARHAHFK